MCVILASLIYIERRQDPPVFTVLLLETVLILTACSRFQWMRVELPRVVTNQDFITITPWGATKRGLWWGTESDVSLLCSWRQWVGGRKKRMKTLLGSKQEGQKLTVFLRFRNKSCYRCGFRSVCQQDVALCCWDVNSISHQLVSNSSHLCLSGGLLSYSLWCKENSCHCC